MRSRFGSIAAARAALFTTGSCAMTSMSAATTMSTPSAFQVAPLQQVRFCSTEGGADEDGASPSNDRDGKRRGDDSTNKIFFNNPELVLRKPNDDITKGCMVRIVQEGDFLALAIHQQNKASAEPKHYTGGRSTLRIAKVLATRMLAVLEGTVPSCELVTRSKTESIVGSVKANPDATISMSGKVTSIPQPGEAETTREFSVDFDLPEGLLIKMFLKEYIHFTTGFHASGHLDSTRVDDHDDDDDYIGRRQQDRREDRDVRQRDDRREFRRDDRRDDRREFRRDDRRDDRREFRRDDRRDDRRGDRRDDRDRRDFRRDDRRDDRRGDRGDRRRDDRNKGVNKEADAKKVEKKAEPAPTRQYASSIY